MDMERKYPTREVDGVDVPQMGIKELIKQLGSALETMEGNRKSYTCLLYTSACEGFGHVVRPRERTAGRGGVAAGHLLDAAHDFIAFGMRQHDVHAETGHQADDALRHGEGFAVGGRIGPAHGDLLALRCV